METVRHIIQDRATWWQPTNPDEGEIVDLLAERGVEYTTVDGWAALDAHEQALGQPLGRARIKVVDRDEMISISRGQ
jgi:ferredoxin--NADP+ reductase